MMNMMGKRYTDDEIKQLVRDVQRIAGEGVETIIDIYINNVEDIWQRSDRETKKVTEQQTKMIIELLTSLKDDVGKHLLGD